MENLSYTATNFSSLFRKIVRLIAAITMMGLVLMFSAVLLIVILTIGAMAWGYLWWRTRDLRKQMRSYSLGDEAIRGEIIEGEAVRVADSGENHPSGQYRSTDSPNVGHCEVSRKNKKGHPER